MSSADTSTHLAGTPTQSQAGNSRPREVPKHFVMFTVPVLTEAGDRLEGLTAKFWASPNLVRSVLHFKAQQAVEKLFAGSRGLNL